MRQVLMLVTLMLFSLIHAQAGEQVYTQNCASCHGADGEGGIGRPALAGNADLEDTQHVLEQILQGGDGMPAYANQLSNEEIAEVATYIRTNWENNFGEVTVAQVEEAAGEQTSQASQPTNQPAQDEQTQQNESQETTSQGEDSSQSQAQSEETSQTSTNETGEQTNDIAAQQQQVADLRVTVLPEEVEFQISGPPGFQTQTFSGGSRMVSGLEPGGYRITANYNGQLLEQVVNVTGGEVSAVTLDFTAEANIQEEVSSAATSQQGTSEQPAALEAEQANQDESDDSQVASTETAQQEQTSEGQTESTQSEQPAENQMDQEQTANEQTPESGEAQSQETNKSQQAEEQTQPTQEQSEAAQVQPSAEENAQQSASEPTEQSQLTEQTSQEEQANQSEETEQSQSAQENEGQAQNDEPTSEQSGETNGGETQSATQATSANGEQLYQQNCASCHGGNGDGGLGPALAGNSSLEDDQEVLHQILVGGNGMPSFANQFSDEQIAAVASYIRTNWGNSFGDISAELVAEQRAQGSQENTSESETQQETTQENSQEETASEETQSDVGQPPGGDAPSEASQEAEEEGEKVTLTGQEPSTNGPTQEELLNASSDVNNWLYANYSFGGKRFVDLEQINVDNVASLRPTCIHQAGVSGSFQANPIIYNGVLYYTTPYLTIAIDAASCEEQWRYKWNLRDDEGGINTQRGVAIKDGLIVRGTTDGYLIALDAANGELIWARQIADPDQGASITMPPLIYEDRIIIGPAGAEFGVRGWVGAFSLENGEELWRFNTIPEDGSEAAETWGNEDALVNGGGALWTPMSLDQETGLVYVPVANPAPDFYGDLRPGINLYTSSMVVLDSATGELQWYYQLVPHDVHDWDTTQAGPIFNIDINGEERKLVATVGKDGLLHVLDRETQEHLYEVPVTTRENVDEPLTLEGVHVCPGWIGGVEWNGPAYNPETEMLYTPAVDWCGVYRIEESVRFIEDSLYLGGSFTIDPIEEAKGWVTAVDAVSGEVAWQYEADTPMIAAVTTTSGGLVFTGDLNGQFLALDANTGEELYRFNTGGGIGGGIVTYELDGTQYVAVMSGNSSRSTWGTEGAATALIFALPETQTQAETQTQE